MRVIFKKEIVQKIYIVKLHYVSELLLFCLSNWRDVIALPVG